MSVFLCPGQTGPLVFFLSGCPRFTRGGVLRRRWSCKPESVARRVPGRPGPRSREAARSLRPTMGNVASNTVNQMAFCPPPPTYRKQDVNMWLETDRGSRIPAFHIRRGYPLTVLVSHANAEDLGIVLGFWSWLSDRLQVSGWRRG